VTTVAVTKSNGELIITRGAVGVVVNAPAHPTHAYRIRFIDGTEAALNRSDFAIRSHFTDPQASVDRLADYDLNRYVIYRCVVGSRAYSLAHETSDTDRRGIYLPPAGLHWSLYGVPEQLENDATQECYWELQKFLVLALKANPNIMSLHAASGSGDAAGARTARSAHWFPFQAHLPNLQRLCHFPISQAATTLEK
jgi:uncharacterized protein